MASRWLKRRKTAVDYIMSIYFIFPLVIAWLVYVFLLTTVIYSNIVSIPIIGLIYLADTLSKLDTHIDL